MNLGIEWNAENQLIEVLENETTVATFEYDPLGRRVEKVVGPTTTTYTYGREDILRQTAGATTTYYVHGPGIDEPLAKEVTGTLAYHHTDAPGSVLKVTDSAGDATHEYRYDGFGRIEAGSTVGAYSFTGREWDSEIGLHYFRARFYDPELGRFISEDPIGLWGGDINFYAYVGNDPVNRADPSGLTWTSNWNFFWDWTLGRGPRNRNYGPNDIETQELMRSPGAEQIRDAFVRGGCKSQTRLHYGTFEAYWDTVANPVTADWSGTGAQVGGFARASVINNMNGTATFTVPNVAGPHSFFLHAVPNRNSPTGPMSNIYQTFQWTEPFPCKCK